ncbi:unnamed protein product [Hymenolepis diminuta]|uniref:TPR_REGION domain-containing protein n=1 Tax=Hymenolepis diminuta TaxID=6216 RepID=A0A0R3STH2_HYMDI|nr:unnamed protein product [Hymenolepis diminuta]
MNLLDANEPVIGAKVIFFIYIIIDSKQSRVIYAAELQSGFVNYDTKVSYALDLLKTKDKNALETAESLLRSNGSVSMKRECLFLIAIANTKLGHYEKAIECCDNLLAVNPEDHQSSDLRAEIDRRRRKEAIIGISLVSSGAVVAVAGIVTALVMLTRRR